MKKYLVNFAAFQVGWFSCVLGAANGMPMLGLAVSFGVVTLHLVSVPRPLPELKLVGIAVLMGLVFDSLLVASGWLRYPSGYFLAGFAPYWILAMWANFATTLNLTMGWLKGRSWLAAVLGGIFGPLTYFGGARLGGIEFVDLAASMIGLGVVWAISMPLLLVLADRFNGLDTRQPRLRLQSVSQGEG
ncbi:MAG: DUF2878 family protein [Xanthomonadales bacterium]|nr:DUF2878 domain-containing protein [Xanthomonadales bacterium]NIX13296.1 DUF2878 family protein [Xanthomonadales bacterium]